MEYSYDEDKRKSNLKKHGLDLADAEQVLESAETVTYEDDRFDYGERRFITIGPLNDELVVIITAETEEHIRIISMRKADKDDKATYQEKH